MSALHVPAGHNLGGRGPGEIALSVVAEIVAALSRLFTLAPGDVILTGTPAGVGPVLRGDVMEASIDGLPPLGVEVI